MVRQYKTVSSLRLTRSMKLAGINGYQIEFKFEDDQSDSEKSVNAYNTLKDWGMQMLVGTTTSTPCTASCRRDTCR